MLNMSMEEIRKSGQALEEYLDRQINRLKEQNYHFQEKQQDDLVVLERYDFNMGDFTKRIVDNTVIPIRHKYLTFIDFDLVSPQRKLKFKRSGLMGKEVSQYDVSTRADIFDKNFMVFVEGKLVDCVKLIPNEQGIDLVIAMKTGMEKTGIDEDEFNEWRRTKAKATIIFFDNSNFNPLIVNREVLRKNGRFLSLQESGIVDELESDERYITFITSKNYGFDNHLVFTPERDEMMALFKSMDDWATNLNRAYINIYGFKNLSEHISLRRGTTSFQITGYKRPIPVKNILVFRDTIKGKRLATDVKIKKYYPNFYTVEGNVNNDPLHLFVFYSPDNEQDVGFTNDLKAYYDTMGNDINAFINAPDIVKNYQPEEFDYTIRDYRNSIFDSPYEYKLDLLSRLADVNPDNLVGFLKEQYTTTDGLFVHVKHIDLEERIRQNNHNEIDDTYQQVEFNEERYIITLKNIDEDGTYGVNYYVDGIRYIPDALFKRGKYTYVYIPKNLIHDDSTIEIERFELFKNDKEFVFDQTNNIARVTVQGNYNRSDIYLIDKDGKYIEPDKYQVFAIENGQYITYDTNDLNFIPHEEVHIMLVDPAYYGPVTIRVDRTQELFMETIAEDVPNTSINMAIDSPPYPEKFRVYSNGRHIPNHLIEVSSDGVHAGNTNVISTIPQKAGDKVLFEYTPNKYTRLLAVNELPTSQVISLQGITTRPFSLSWYDLYLNGRKLTKNNVRVLSPYLIQIVNVDSIYNFEIYERQTYTDAITSYTKTIIDRLWEEDEAFREGLLNYDNGSKNEELDIFEEVYYFYLDQLKNFWLREMKASFYHINPDINQITPEVQAKYPKLFAGLQYFHLNGELHGPDQYGVEVLHINPDDVAISEYAKDLYDLFLYLDRVGVHINPDNQIDDSITSQFPVIFGEGNGVFINPDTVYAHPDSPLLHINPDN